MRHSNFMIGNSSSGIIESATTKTKVINIGNRQKEKNNAKKCDKFQI